MKNKILVNMVSLAIAFGCIFTCSNFMFNVKAYENVVNVPKQGLYVITNLINASNDGIIMNSSGYPVTPDVDIIDNSFNIVFSSNSKDDPNTGLDAPVSGNSYFVVFKDHIKGTILSMQPLNIGEIYFDEESGISLIGYAVNGEFNNNIDVVDVEIYSQSTSADKYYPSSATFIGKMRLFTASNSIYLRQGNTQVPIKLYDEEGSELTDASLFYNRLTPNLYSIYVPDGNLPFPLYKSCCQILTDSTNMSAEDKFVPEMFFLLYYPEGYNVRVAKGSQVIPDTAFARLYNFYIPDGVTSFKFKIYDTFTSERLVAQGNINLTRD